LLIALSALAMPGKRDSNGGMANEAGPSGGFGHSKRRVAAEVGIVVGGLALCVLLVVWIGKNLAGWLTAFVPDSLDQTLGEQAFSTLAPEGQRCTRREAVEYIEGLVRTLPPEVSGPYELKFAVVDSPEVNAFALPGGFISVNFGLLSKAESGEEVLGVLAHEIGHVRLRHGTRRILREVGTAVAIGALFGGTDISMPAGLVAGLMSSAYDRDQETEADDSAIEALRAAGIDPLGMSRFFERLATEGAAVHMPELLSTHPDPGDRAERTARMAKGTVITKTLPSPRDLRCR
jgi:beta-barrel assembly-enhancing protease